jgi:hypothetical protein
MFWSFWGCGVICYSVYQELDKNAQQKINKQNIDNSECLGVKYVKMYPEMTSQ